MLRDRRLAHRERLDQVADAALREAKLVHDPPSRRLGEGGERIHAVSMPPTLYECQGIYELQDLTRDRLRPRLRDDRGATARRAGRALAPPADPRRHRAGARNALLEVGCGAGAVLAVLGQEFPGLRLTGVDIEPKQLEFARGHLERAGVEATLVQGDARAPLSGRVLRPRVDDVVPRARRRPSGRTAGGPAGARPGGGVTAIEVDYSTCRADPTTPGIDALIRAMVQGMAASGWSDAGTRPRAGWPRRASGTSTRACDRSWWTDDDLAGRRPTTRRTCWRAHSMRSPVSPIPARRSLHRARGPAEPPRLPGAGLGWVVHKSTALR